MSSLARLLCTLVAVGAGLGLLAGCASPRPTAGSVPAGHPGFDAWRYPGDALMEAWRAASPYEWVGYYLPAPCHRDSSWVGRRAGLERMGWGMAVLYVGQQVFEGEPDAEPGEGPILCSRTLLTAERGRADAHDAILRARADGFPIGTTIFLDIERVERVPDALLVYYRAWLHALLADGQYQPGVYAHRANAAVLFAEGLAVSRAAGRGDALPFWISGGTGFALDRAPTAVGFSFATVWQGVLDVERTWGGASLRIDENVAARPSPSAPRPVREVGAPGD